MATKKFQPLDRAVQQAQSLSNLLQKMEQSKAMRACLDDFIAPAMRPFVMAGPIENDVYQLLVTNNALIAKLRQLKPALVQRLHLRGFAVKDISFKIMYKTQTP